MIFTMPPVCSLRCRMLMGVMQPAGIVKDTRGVAQNPIATSHADHSKGDAGERAADEWPQDRDRRVAPVRRSLSGDWKQSMRNTRAQIARRIDGITGRAAEREPDAPDQASHQISATGPAAGLFEKIAPTTKTSTKVPITSLNRFGMNRRMAGAVQKHARFREASGVSFQCGK